MPKVTVSDYPGMLRKLAAATLLVTIGSVLLIRATVNEADSLLQNLDKLIPDVPIGNGVNIPLGTILPAILVACLFAALKMHDKVSDIFKIRFRFDVRHILIPMALLSGATLTSSQFDNLSRERGRLMGDVFYAFATSSAGREAIDRHAITQALTAWSWYWICVETIIVLVLLTLILVLAHQYEWATYVLIGIILLLGVMRLFQNECAKYAASQIRQILNDPDRRAQIAATFNAL